jgi:hypothetical protein
MFRTSVCPNFLTATLIFPSANDDEGQSDGFQDGGLSSGLLDDSEDLPGRPFPPGKKPQEPQHKPGARGPTGRMANYDEDDIDIDEADMDKYYDDEQGPSEGWDGYVSGDSDHKDAVEDMRKELLSRNSRLRAKKEKKKMRDTGSP